MSQKIVTNLWFDGAAEEAANHYISIFGEDSRIELVTRYPADSPGPEGSVMTVEWTLRGQKFVGINGGPEFPFTEAFSLQVNCAGQEEIDYFWDRLLEGGEPSHCGWLKDRFGVAWQVVPEGMDEVFAGPDRGRAERVMQAMLQMVKIDAEELRRAAVGA